MPIELTDQEKLLFGRLQQFIADFRKQMGRGAVSSELIDEMERNAVELDRSLRARGQPPVHHKYMIENRGCQPTDPGFYHHLHPIEDLVRFILDPRANVNPEDQTIGWEGTFRVYTRRWKHEDTYDIRRTPTGWTISFMSGPVECDKTGHPYLFEALRHDSIQYPNDLGGWLDWLWNQARDKGLTAAQLAKAVQELADWVSVVERSVPTGDIWGGYA